MIRIELTEDDLGALIGYLDIAVKQVGIQSVKNMFILLAKLESGVKVEDAPEDKPAVIEKAQDKPAKGK